MLKILRRIVQEVNAAQDLDRVLQVIVSRVREAMGADVCSIYLTDHARGELVLMASEGLDPRSVGKVRLARDKGLVGLVSEREEPLNLDDAPAHPRFVYIPETGEAPFHGFLGVPIVHRRRVLGVLVVQRRERLRYSEEAVSFLVTTAAQLAGAIAHAEASGDISNLVYPLSFPPLQGRPAAPGVALGQAVVRSSPADLEVIPERHAQDMEEELAAFEAAVQEVLADIQALKHRLEAVLTGEERLLFDAYLLMLQGGSLITKTVERIREGQWALSALRATVYEHVKLFEAMDDRYLRERAADVRDLGRRIMERLQKQVQEHDYPPATILVGEEITASMLAAVPPGRLAGVISVQGSQASHAAILARALNVPTVVGVDDLPLHHLQGKEVIVDGYTGRIYISPSREIRREYLKLLEEERQLTEEFESLRDLPAETPDGVHIPLYVNTGLLADITPGLQSGAEGIGLYRTEFPFLIRDRFPGEREQCQVYRQVLAAFAPRPVVLRTLDVGGDKALPYFPIREDNPFLGWRGIRITLDHPEIFLTQLRAMIKASAGLGNLHLLLPMVSHLSEVDEAVALIRRAYEELREEGEAVVLPRIGVMVEVPSMVYQAKALAARVDFLSIGSNDLTQYLLAVDRNNARVAPLYDALHPSVLQALRQVVEGAHGQGKPVSVCGEIAGDPAAVILLLGMGVDSLSASAANLPRIKWVIRSFRREEAQRLLEQALGCEDPATIRQHLNQALERKGLGKLVHPGR